MGTTAGYINGRQIKFPKELDDRLQAEADARMLSPHLLVIRATEKFLNELVPVETHLATVMRGAEVVAPPSVVVMKDDS